MSRVIHFLVDCDSYYVSVQRSFDPSIEGKPCVVLSSNDGNVVTRNKAAKALGIKMSQPYFQLKDDPKYRDLVAYSANFALYASTTEKIKAVLETFPVSLTPYSIDESFGHYVRPASHHRSVELGMQIKRTIKKHVGIPVSCGFGHSRVLAKLATAIAKDYPIFEGVVDLTSWEPHKVLEYMAMMPVSEIWGIGRQLTNALDELGIKTVLDLKLMDPEMARQKFSVVVERIVRELNGMPCIEIGEPDAEKKQIISSRSFGLPVYDLPELSQAVSQFISQAAEKVRRQGSVARGVTVFIGTSPFRDEPQYRKSATIDLPAPVNDTLKLNEAAQWVLKKIFKPGYRYKKAGVMLTDIVPAGLAQDDLFGYAQGEGKRTGLMNAMDAINRKYGRNTLRVASMGFEHVWKVNSNMLSPFYTTRIEDLPVAR